MQLAPEQARKRVSELLAYFGEDPKREGLRDTPKRFINAFGELLSGYRTPMPEFAIFNSSYDEMVVVSPINCISFCEHHVLPILIEASIGYIPDKKVVGISKIPRLVKWCCARLVIQENLTGKIADILTARLNPLGVAVVLKGRHLCMEIRGVKTRSTITTSALRGAFREPVSEGLHPVDEFLKHCQESRRMS